MSAGKDVRQGAQQRGMSECCFTQAARAMKCRAMPAAQLRDARLRRDGVKGAPPKQPLRASPRDALCVIASRHKALRQRKIWRAAYMCEARRYAASSVNDINAQLLRDIFRHNDDEPRRCPSHAARTMTLMLRDDLMRSAATCAARHVQRWRAAATTRRAADTAAPAQRRADAMLARCLPSAMRAMMLMPPPSVSSRYEDEANSRASPRTSAEDVLMAMPRHAAYRVSRRASPA